MELKKNDAEAAKAMVTENLIKSRDQIEARLQHLVFGDWVLGWDHGLFAGVEKGVSAFGIATGFATAMIFKSQMGAQAWQDRCGLINGAGVYAKPIRAIDAGIRCIATIDSLLADINRAA